MTTAAITMLRYHCRKYLILILGKQRCSKLKDLSSFFFSFFTSCYRYGSAYNGSGYYDDGGYGGRGKFARSRFVLNYFHF